MKMKTICLFCIQLMLLILLMPPLIIHELGHLLLALAFRFPVQSFNIGSAGEILFQSFLGNISFKVYNKIDGASVIINFTDKAYPRWQFIAVLSAGWLMNLLIALVCFFIITDPVGLVYGAINLFFVIASIWPSKGSDGYCCYELLRGQIPISWLDKK